MGKLLDLNFFDVILSIITWVICTVLNSIILIL